jgi:hypothetical protein
MDQEYSHRLSEVRRHRTQLSRFCQWRETAAPAIVFADEGRNALNVCRECGHIR